MNFNLVELVNDVRKELNEDDTQIEKGNYMLPELEKTLEILKDDTIEFIENWINKWKPDWI